MKITRTFFLLFSLILSATGLAADQLMLRSGDLIEGKLIKISDSEVSFRPITGKGGMFSKAKMGDEMKLDLNSVYMVKTEKRGTIFLVNGQRVIRENVEIPKDADVIYLVEGMEIPAWQLKLENGIISYQKEKEKKRAMSNIGAFPQEEVFMVKYSDGSVDVFTELPEYKKQPKTQARQEESSAPQFKVIFHNVKSGETLAAIAERYDVSVEEIIEWNELPARTTARTRLKVGTQLMLQVKNQ